MASKITRFFQYVWASAAEATPTGLLAKVGSLANGSIGYTNDPLQMQNAFNTWVTGLQASWVPGSQKSPAYQDWNSILNVITKQLAYILQQGVPEWETNTTYFVGSMAKPVGGNQIYVSLQDNNQGNALTNPTYWRTMLDPKQAASAWANMYLDAGTIAIRTSYNITSVVPITIGPSAGASGGGSGSQRGYQVNFNGSFTNAGYCAIITGGDWNHQYCDYVREVFRDSAGTYIQFAVTASQGVTPSAGNSSGNVNIVIFSENPLV